MHSSSRKTRTVPQAINPVPYRLAGKVAVITGGARGIGKAIASRFSSEGAAILIADKDVNGAEKAISEINEEGGVANLISADVSNRGDATAIISRAVQLYGGVDILVNNAGIIEFGGLLDCTAEAWDKMLAVDLSGAFYCTQAAAQQMILQKRGGRLLHVGSTASLFPAPFQAAYSIAKAGLLMLSRVAALEFVEHGITSNLLCPHGAVTDMNRDLLKDPAVMERLERHIPAGRLADVDEIAGAAAFLVSEEAAYITGTELVHDGGSSICSLWWR